MSTTYTTMGLARAILAIKRDFEAQGRDITIENVYSLLITSLPGDVTLAEFRRGIYMAADLRLTQRRHKRDLRR
jgi:hypothetical protein